MDKLKRGSVLSFILLGILGLAGCVQADTATFDPEAGRNFLLRGVGLVVFGLALLYAGVRAFLTFNEVTDGSNIEGRIQLSGFAAGVLLGVLVMAVDSAPTPVSISALLGSLPMIVLIVLGIFGGLFVGILSAVIAIIRKADTSGLVILTLSFVSSTGIYLLLFTNTSPGLILPGFVSLLVGLLIFRMIFPVKVTSEE
ncbi:MAG: hypothetical protein KDJ65_25160 [Anaerolineae bacterium]|nr:hypothetical protein [Anaerolineae bacterium]